MNYWQIASGSFGREYSAVFLKYGIAAVGGELQIARMKEVKTGDRVILKRGQREIVAVGEVVERNGSPTGTDSRWLSDFDGWNLSAYSHVDWHQPNRAEPVSGLTRSTIDQVHLDGVKEKAEQILRDVPCKEAAPEPEAPQIIQDDALLVYLVQEGLSPQSAESLTGALRRIRLLADYYYQAKDFKWDDIREHETRTFLIVPLLLAFGWPEQQLKIEWPCQNGRIDIACFSKRFRGVGSEENQYNLGDVSLIIESKGFASGLDFARAQAETYAKEFPSCQAYVVSNGYCYKAYRRNSNEGFPWDRYAYLNIIRPTRYYPLDPDNVAGAREVLKLLLPGGGKI